MNENKIVDESKDLDNKPESTISGIWDWVKSFIVALVLALLIKAFVFEPTQVLGSSMERTLHTGDRVIVNKIGLKFKPIERGNIIVMHFNPVDEDYIKRVIGIPGDIVQLIDGNFYVNGNMITETYKYGDYTNQINESEWKLEKDQYFVAGDNRYPGMSKDSRDFGPVELKDIKGVATLRFYPFGESFGMLK